MAKRVRLAAVIPAALVGTVVAAVGAAAGCRTSKEVLLEKGGDALCSLRKKK